MGIIYSRMSELVLAGLVVSGAWTQLDEIGWMGWAPLLLAALLDRFYPRKFWRPHFPPFSPDRGALIAATALCAWLVAHLALTFREEFGFSGDEGYHLSATRAFAIYFMRAGPFLLAALAAYAVLKVRGHRYAATIATAALTASSFALPANPLFGRYPTGFYLIATPLNVLFDVLHSPYPYSANHAMNIVSLPAWLFVLRPLVIGRWPDWRVMIVALLVYFNPASLTLMSSPMLEPWAIVFMLLSLEALTFEPDRRWIAVPLCALAIAFKETMFLLLPTVWLLASVEWRDGRLVLRRESLALGAAAAAPFITYYVVRAELTTSRGYVFGGAATLTPARIVEWLSNARAQLGAGGLVAIAAAAALSIASGPLWIATAAGIAAFFLADLISVPWTGYSRFLVYSLLAICGAVFAALHKRQLGQRTLIAGCIAIVVLQLPQTFKTFMLDWQPDHARNSLEWNGVLVRMPIRTLARQIASLPGGDLVRTVRVTAFATDLISLPVAYPDLAARYTLRASSSDCACRENAEAVIGVFAWPANLGDSAVARQNFDETSAACIQQLEATGSKTVTATDPSGAAVGALGVGRR